MKHWLAPLWSFLFLSAVIYSAAGQNTPYNVTDASYAPVSLDYASTVKLLPKKLRPAGTAPHRCLVLKVTIRLPESGVFYPLYFDRFSLSLGPTQGSVVVPAVGLGIGPLPLKAGDPQDKWTDQWEIGKSKGTFSVMGDPVKTSEIKLLFLVPVDVTQVTLMQKGTRGEQLVVKEGIAVPASD